jgi:MOSC domain-containing protein YiiM
VLGEDKAKVVKAMVHRSGLRARILTTGTIHRGDPIQVQEPALV